MVQNSAAPHEDAGRERAYLYFLSYPRSSADEYLREFYRDLDEEVRVRLLAAPADTRVVGDGRPTRLGFFDQEGLERGADWPEELEQALQQCHCFVALYGPSYFVRGFAERELRAFEARRLAAGNVNARDVVKPVLWLPTFNVPTDLGHLQYQVGDPRSLQNTKGLRSLKKLPNDPEYKKAYNSFLEDLAQEIVDSRKAVMPRFAGVGSILRGSPAAAPSPRPEGNQPSVSPMGPSHVQFVYVAASRPDLRDFSQGDLASVLDMPRCPDYYGEQRSAEWRPYLPDDPRFIGALAQAIAGHENFTSAEIPAVDPSKSLRELIREAERRQNLVLLLVDGWAVLLPRLEKTLADVDEWSFVNCAFLIPWNGSDSQSCHVRERLESRLRATLKRWARNPNYLRSADTVDTFSAELRKMLVLLKREVVANGRERDIPITPRPIVRNTLEDY